MHHDMGSYNCRNRVKVDSGHSMVCICIPVALTMWTIVIVGHCLTTYTVLHLLVDSLHCISSCSSISSKQSLFYLLKRNTPLEGFYSPFLTLSTEGHPVEYEGILASRIAPTKDEFVLLKAGESIAASVQITDVFNIDTDGLYTVQYSKPFPKISSKH